MSCIFTGIVNIIASVEPNNYPVLGSYPKGLKNFNLALSRKVLLGYLDFTGCCSDIWKKSKANFLLTEFLGSRYCTKGHGREPKPMVTPWMSATFPSLEPSMPIWWTVRSVWPFPLLGLGVFMGTGVAQQGSGEARGYWRIPLILIVEPTSQLKYKETYEKQKGHYLAGKEISEFPGVVHCLDFQKMRSVVSQCLL